MLSTAFAQVSVPDQSLGSEAAARLRTQRFLAGRTLPPTGGTAGALTPAAALAQARARPATVTTLGTQWTPLGPGAVNSALYGPVTGRITSVALDPNDATGNTVWLGTTGGGVWKSTNAAGSASAVTFTPLTDTIPVFQVQTEYNPPSLSIGAVSVQPAPNPVVLAGTGDPNDALDSYYGTGILRSADGGQTWTVATQSLDGVASNHTFMGMSGAGFAWSTLNPSLVVAAMATSVEGLFVGAPNQTGTLTDPGIYYSTDAGLTWHMGTALDSNPMISGSQYVQQPKPLGTTQISNTITSVVWVPQRQMFIAAMQFHGYYSSTDGQNWARLVHQPGTGFTYTNCPVGQYGQGADSCPIVRGALAVQPATGDLYAFSVDNQNRDQGIWQDICNAGSNGLCSNAAPTFAHRVDSGELEVGQGATGGSTVVRQGLYNLSLSAAPGANNSTILFAGDIDLFRCVLNAGATSCSFRNTTNAGNGCNATSAVAPAQHALASLPQSTGMPLLYIGNDGGLWRSTDGVAETGATCSSNDANHFQNLNSAIGLGGSLAEVVGFAQDPSLNNTLIAGIGELGTASTFANPTTLAWTQLSGGEGGFPQIDQVSPQNWYVAVGAGVNLKGCTLGAACAATNFAGSSDIGPIQTGYDASVIDAPTLLDPQNQSLVLAGTCRVWRGPIQSASSWSSSNALSTAMDGGATPCTFSSSLIRSLAAGGPVSTAGPTQNQGSQVLYAGLAGFYDGGASLPGHIFVTKTANTATGSTAWTDVTGGTVQNSYFSFNSSGFDLSSVVIDPHDATGGTVYATIMGFAAGPHVYRSTDFGAHWITVSANVPDVPVNALVVDPNDANTVYVATDAGVYVTQAIATCASQNCWSILGTGLPYSPVTQLQIGAALPTGDGRVGMLRAGTYGRGLWQIPLITAHSVQQPQLSASPGSLSFLSQPVGTQSSALAVSLLSYGNAPATITSIVVTGDFTETDSCVGTSIAAGQNCTVSVRFAPTVTGGRSGLLTIYANIPGGQITVPLTGTGTTPAAVVLTPLQLTFSATTVNQTARAQIVTVSNTGGNTATLQSVTITGDFAIGANTCGTSLASQVGCSISISFTPTASGTRTGVLTVVDSAGTQTAQLLGTGQSPATDTLTPTSLSFATQQTGTTSAAQQVTLTNAGDVPLTLIAASILTGDFTVNSACGVSLIPHSSCAINVAFVPTATGTRTGQLQVTDQFRTQLITLNGAGVAPAGVSLSPSTISFGPIGLGLTSATATVVLTNNGGQPLLLSSTTVVGDFQIASNSCSASLPPAAACNLVISFAPTQAGPRTGSLTLTDNALQGTQTVTLSGTGIDFALAADGPTAVTVTSGGIATFPMQLTSLAGLSGTVSFTCTGAPANAACTINPSPAQLGSTVLVTATLQTGIVTAGLRRSAPPSASARIVLLCFLGVPFAFFGLRRGATRRAIPRCLGALLLLTLLPSLCGCGSTRLIPLSGTLSTGSGDGTSTGGGSSPTKTGTYPITVTATCDGVAHTLAMSLVVQ